MKKIILVLAAAALLLVSACHSSETGGGHWPRSSGTQSLVIFQVEPSGDIFRNWVSQNAQDWSANPRIEVRVRTCAAGENCVKVKGDPNVNGGVTGGSADAQGHLFAEITWNNRAGQDPANLDNGLCHEMGHALGLWHSTDGTPGPCQGGKPTAHDMSLVTENHSHSHPTGPPGV